MLSILGCVIWHAILFVTGAAQSTSILETTIDLLKYMTDPSTVVAFLPISTASAVFVSASGFANQHVTIVEAYLSVSKLTTDVDNIFGWFTMQTKKNGDYSIDFLSFTTYDVTGGTLASTWVSCSGTPGDSIRTCTSSGQTISARSSTETITYSAMNSDYSTVNLTETLRETDLIPTLAFTSPPVLMTMGDYLHTISVGSFLRPRTSTTQPKSTSSLPVQTTSPQAGST